MNTLIFKPNESLTFIPDADPRAEHIAKYLKPADGDEVFMGVLNHGLFKAKIYKTNGGYRLSEERTALPNPPVCGLCVYVAFTRPQIAKRIMFEAACFGIKKLSFYAASKGEADYAKSALYTKEYEDYLIKGAEQACAANIPEFALFKDLSEAVADSQNARIKFAPDLYEASIPFPDSIARDESAAIIFGGERGFSNPDRDILRGGGFQLASLGPRVLRTDTAIIAALSKIKF